MIHGHGDDLYKYGNKIKTNFSSNIYSQFDHSGLYRHIADILTEIEHYPEPVPLSLEQELAKMHNIPADCVVATNGATEAIYKLAQLYGGATACILQPTFAEYADACKSTCAAVETCRSLDEICKRCANKNHGENRITTWICNPNNPTGETFDHRQIMETAATFPDDIFIIDESYAAYTEKRTVEPEEAICAGNVFIIRSMTKDYGVPGLRIGYVIAAEPLCRSLRSSPMPWAMSQITIEAAKYLIAHRDEYVIDAHKLCKERERMAEALSKMNIHTYHSDSNILLCKLPAAITASSLKETLASKEGILIRDASNFEGLTRSHFRIAVQEREMNDKLIEALKAGLKNHL